MKAGDACKISGKNSAFGNQQTGGRQKILRGAVQENRAASRTVQMRGTLREQRRVNGRRSRYAKAMAAVAAMPATRALAG
jgi:hypothetical protein